MLLKTLAYMADMQESGVPVTYGYISDLHGNEAHPPTQRSATRPRAPSGAAARCYVGQAQYYDAAFEAFFERLAAEGHYAEEHRVRVQQ